MMHSLRAETQPVVAAGIAYVGTEGSAYVDIVETGVSLFTPDGPSFPDTTYWPLLHGIRAGRPADRPVAARGGPARR